MGDETTAASVAELVADVMTGITADPGTAPAHMERDARAALAELSYRAEAAEAALAAAQAELTQARADRTLIAGLWLGTVPHDVLPALLPADRDSRDRLTAALDAVDLPPSAEAHTAAGAAVIARIVAETAGGER